jgi:homoserine O-acetyltransferase
MLQSRTQILELFNAHKPFELESGQVLPHVQVAYETYGQLDADGSNAILVCHALTGDAHAAGITEIDTSILQSIPLYAAKKPDQPGWWDGLIGPGKALDTERYFVISSNILGSCYGSTGPTSPDPKAGKPYGPNFPQISVRDMVKVQRALLNALGIRQLVTVIGGSLGGMQVLEWALLFPEMVQSLIPIATAARHSAWAIGFDHLARQAVMNDPHWNNGFYTSQPAQGLSLARQIGMISYRTDISFQQRFGRKLQPDENDKRFQVESYLSYQGEKLVRRFDANTLITLTRAMDAHDVGRERDGTENALAQIKAPALCLGIDSDILYPAAEQKEIARHIPNARYEEIHSPNGHDAFLIEYDQLNEIIRTFLQTL